MVPFLGAKSSWFGWEKVVFSLGFHLRLWPRSFWGMQHLWKLKIAKIFFFRVSERIALFLLLEDHPGGIWFGQSANRAIVIGFRWILQRWKALEKVHEGCHNGRALATTFKTKNPVWIPIFLRLYRYGYIGFQRGGRKNVENCSKFKILEFLT